MGKFEQFKENRNCSERRNWRKSCLSKKKLIKSNLKYLHKYNRLTKSYFEGIIK